MARVSINYMKQHRSNDKRELFTLGHRLREGAHSVQPTTLRRSRPSPPLLCPTPSTNRYRREKPQWLVRSVSPTEFKFPNDKAQLPPVSASPHRAQQYACIPVTVTRSTVAKPSLLDFYRIKPVLVDTALTHSRESVEYYQSDEHRPALFPPLHSERPLSIFLDIKHRLPPLKPVPLPASSKPSEDQVLREVKRLRKQRDEEIERVMQSVREEFELDRLQEAGLGGARNVFKDV